ncbi:MAG: AcrR family transcriptional regulator [Bacteroidia bacterium]|jgi:AcrR family transcriptional regulator
MDFPAVSIPPKKTTCEAAKTPGRPRSEAARQAILAAAYELLCEKPLPEITAAALAQRAGVSKATLYRWWTSKEAIVLDGYFEAIDQHFTGPCSDDPLADLALHLRRGYAAMAGPDGTIFASLVASGHFHPEVRKALNEQLNSPRCKDTETILMRAIEAGQLRMDLDPELATKLLFGPLFERLMIGESLEPDLSDRILGLVLPGLKPRP